jgi:hypothetical protein
VHNRLGDVVAHTDGWARLMGPLGALDGDANLVRYVFGDERARRAFPAWAQVADHLGAVVLEGNHRGDAALDRLLATLPVDGRAELVDRLSGPAETRMRATGAHAGVVRVAHPEVGELRLAQEAMPLADVALHLVAFLPADDASAEALDRLLRPPGALRAVSG